ncbi:gamma-glutamyltransferase family protein [Sabulicella glaciei]|uniref:Gamma-glutamyltransferase family protein n=1 Tax=Sabulicella glaciei TaxID=2984948 RepID=A0ABT3NQD9_9PROT|nr:gamma-glutamyltransferase family protein [Roseococcus sp. MDT2-1-1]MCW8084373.1 gamma-glutamyltransferase family protein [Roseococcus sp. MDT2-1-1]
MRDFHAPGRSPVLAGRGMAATSMPAASLAAIEVLKGGGNALDAAIAAVALLGVIEPQSTGIGGDCFCLYAPAGTGQVIAMNGSGRAPAGATPEVLRAAGLSAMVNTSAHSVTIPGAVAAWEKLNAAYGRRGLDVLLQPAIRAAEKGFHVHSRVAHDWSEAEGKLTSHPASARRYLKDGAAPRMGDRMEFPALGRTLGAIARNGARAFYEGEIAADMVRTLRDAGGTHTEADFAAGLNGPEFVTPIQRRFKGLDIFECPPNGTGIIALMMLGLLEGFGPAPDGPLGLTRLHRHIEAGRLAYRDRDAFIADPAHVDVPVEKLLSDEYLQALARNIRDDAASELPPAGQALLPVHADTVYLCVVDEEGNACSFINSLFESFGSGILAEESGVMLHNRGFGFRLQEGHPNCIAPGKRPMHTIIPGMAMKDGQVHMPFGVMGGHFQPMGQSLLLTNMLDYGLDVQQALDLPRLFPREGRIQVERGIPAEVVRGLNAMGHDCLDFEKPHGGGQAIVIDRERGCLIGGSDPRKDGCALGY